MTDDTKVPPWLADHQSGASRFELTDAFHGLLGEAEGWERGDSAFKTLPEWLAWRERVAAALKLVDPDRMTLEDWRARMGFTGGDAKARNRAIAAELRRLADHYAAIDPGGRDEAIADELRARADELDPQG